MVEREVFANAPLRLVSLEMRFPLTSRVLARGVFDSFENALGSRLPLVETFVDDIDEHVPGSTYEPILRRLAHDRKRAVTLHAGAVTVELGDYLHYEDLVDLTTATLGALPTWEEGLRCYRIGLRYINEVRSEQCHDAEGAWQQPSAWEPFVNPQLVRDVEDTPDGLCAYGQRASILFHTLEGHEHVVLDYGARPSGIVESDGVLSLDDPTGPCFLLDIDGFVVGSPKEPVALDRDGVLKSLDGLHDAVERVFLWSITDRLKDEVLRVAPESADESGGVRRVVNG